MLPLHLHIPPRSNPLPLLRIPPPPLCPPRIDRLLAQMAEAIPPLKAGLHQRIRIHQPPRNGLHDLKNLHWVIHGSYLRLTDLEDRERDAEECLGPFVKERVPHAERRFDGQGSDEAGHEPCGAAERYGWEAHGRRYLRGGGGGGGRAVKLAAYFGPDGGHGFFDTAHEHAEVDVYAFEVDFMRGRQVVAGDYVEEPERFFLIHEKKEEASQVV